MDTKPAVVIGVSLVLAGALIAFGPRFVPPSNPANPELAQVKDELAKLRAAIAPAPAAAGKAADLKWARSIAEDFIRAVKAKDEKVAHALLSAESRDRLTDKERKEGKIDFGPFERKVNDTDAYRIFDAWSIAGEELAPNGAEARFTGKLTYAPPPPFLGHVAVPTGDYPFTLVVTRGKDPGLWRVGIFAIAREKDK